jgi:membrane protein YqaA with SNARE-associated domain
MDKMALLFPVKAEPVPLRGHKASASIYAAKKCRQPDFIGNHTVIKEANMDEKRSNIIRRLYDWVLHWADTPYGTPALAVNSFAEASFFPIPPDVLLIALDLGKPKRSWYYAFMCTIFSVLGGILGYYIGYGLWESVGKSIVDFYNANEIFDKLASTFAAYNFWAVLIAALTPIPYKIFTISAGVAASTLFSHSQSAWAVEDALVQIFGIAQVQELGGMLNHTGFFLTFLTASILGRSIRFFAVSALIYFFGETIKTFIDRYFNWLSIAFVVLLLGGFYLVSKLG